MIEPFIKDEQQSQIKTTWNLNIRLFRELPLFRKLFLLSLILILLSSVAPSVFRWYSGKYSTGIEGFTLSKLWLITGIAVFCRIGAWMSFEISGMWASQRIHHDMVRALMRTRTTYFDENPSSRLINRLVRDFDEVRGTAIIFVGDLLNASVEIFSIGVIAALAHPVAGILIFPLLGIFSYIQYYRSSMLSHTRSLSAVATSNVIARESDLIEGREVFLLYGKSDHLLKRMGESFRTYLQASALNSLIDAWGSFWIRFSAEAFSFLVLLFTTYSLYHAKIDATLAGVIISCLFGVTGSIGWLDFATGLISRSVPHVQRVFEIVDLPPEETEEGISRTKKSSPPLRFETIPDLVFKNYTMSYRSDSPIILEGLDATIRGGKRTALIGRTGSGKTSITQALLRMVYVHGGDICLGDRSLFSYDVRELRRLFGVIPQSPYLFEGTLRSNLDLTESLTDEKLQTALEAVGLKFPLDYSIQEGGKNLSQGERQLACLARVIAAQKQFIIMDEATSGLDPETDAKITQILKREFSDKTVITIAHRMETIAQYEWVIELDQGKIVPPESEKK